MDFEFTEEEEELRASVRRFLADRAPLRYVRGMLEDPIGTTSEVWKELAELGAVGLLVPAADGGAGAPLTTMGVVLEELGRVAHPGPFLASAVGATTALVELGGDPLLASLADGSSIATLAVFEPGQRWVWGAPTTNASSDERLTGTRITGTKVQVPDAAAASTLLVTAATPGGGLGLYAVEAAAVGVVVTPTPSPDGTRKVATVELDGAPARRVGTGDATAAMAAALDRLAVAYVVDGVGAASAALELAVAYAKERVQFGQPIGSFQAVQHLCADMLQSLELARAGAYYALWADGSDDTAERHLAATMAKAYASDALSHLGADAIQVFAGIGYTWEHDAHLFYKRLLTLEHVLGDSAMHLEELARLVID